MKRSLPVPPRRRDAGFTMVELLVGLSIMAVVVGILSTMLMTSNRTHQATVARAETQASSRTAMSLLTTELAQTGADPTIPPSGVVGIALADTQSIHIRADRNADGAIQTTEPSEDITYTYNPGTQILSRNPGAGAATLLTDVTNLRFTYFNAANQPLTSLPLNATDRGLVRSIGISLTCQEQGAHPLTLQTRITVRNQ